MDSDTGNERGNLNTLNRFVDATACLSPLRFENHTRIKELDMRETDCVRIYREEGCRGPFITLRSRYIFYAFRWNHENDKASSLGPCDEECSPEHIQNIQSNVLLTIQDDKSQMGVNGYNATINITGCVIIPRIFNRTLSKHIKVSDLDRLDDSICVEVHEHSNCTGLSVSYRPRFPWAGAVNRQTTEVWRTYRSVSVCGYNCIRQSKKDKEMDKRVSPGPQFVTLFDEPNFNGNVIDISLSKGCANISHEWEGESLAIKTYSQCVIAYDQFGCTSIATQKNYLLLESVNMNLHANLQQFKMRIRSMELCFGYDATGFDGSMASQLEGRNGVRIFFKDSLRTQYLEAHNCTSPASSTNELATIYWTEPLDPKGCINLYRYEHCRGEHITKRFQDSSNDYYWEDDTRALITYRSIGPCNDNCISNFNPVLNKSIPVEVFLYSNYSKEAKRDRTLVKIDGEANCVLVPRIKQKLVEFYEVKGQEGSGLCFELHKNWNCSGGSTKGRNQQSDVDRTDNHWKFISASSISHCGYKNCKNGIVQGRHGSSLINGPSSDTQNHNIVTLFDESNFNGNSKDFDLSNGCINITGEWEGGSNSMKIYNQCVYIFSQFGCSNSIENLLLDDSNKNSHANFPFKWGIKSINICPSDNVNQMGQILTFTILGILAVGLSVALAVIIYLKRRVRTFLTKQEIHDFQNGIENFEDMENDEVSAENLPYDQSYEILKENIVIDKGSQLGAGAYAVVYVGRVKRLSGEDQKVAVKTMKPYSNVEFTRTLLLEIKTMIYVGQHERIIELIGCCTQNLKNGELYVMTELCRNGSMESFLRNHISKFTNFVNDEGEICIPKTEADEQGYLNSRMESISSSYFNTIHSLQWSLQIAQGMEYLAFKKVIHGDLATRNVLLDLNFNIKISDFGLSRQLYQYSQYVKKSHAPLPWRWLGIECLHSYSFSTESDVWAYGVTLWEIFTLGHVPYPDRNWDDTFLTGLCNGLRLSKPNYAPLDLFEIMTKCWVEIPTSRISFPDLKIRISNMLDRYSEFTGCPSYNKDYMYVHLSD